MKKLVWILILLPLFAQQIQAQRIISRKEISEIRQHGKKLKRAYETVAFRYYDTLNYSAVVDSAINAMIAGLDPHTSYKDPQQAKSSLQRLEKRYNGLGISTRPLKDTLVILHLERGGPAEKSGLLPGDRIIAIGGRNIVGLGQKEVAELLSGEKNSKESLEVLRHPDMRTLQITVERDYLPVRAIPAAYAIDDRTGYVRIDQFGTTAAKELQAAMASMPEIEDIIIDLRGNPGGLINAAVDMAGMFLNKGDLITITEGKRARTRSMKAKRDGEYRSGRILILVDQASGSASELFTGALQDWDRALVLGSRTFGKGLGQNRVKFSDGSALTVTSTRYLTPSGRAVQRPFERGHREEYYETFYDRYYYDRDGDEQGNAYKTLISGRTVYDGGGITPDLRFDTDTLFRTPFYEAVMRKELLSDYIIVFLDSHRAELSETYRDVEDFARRFDPATIDLKPLAKMASEAEIEYSDDEFSACAAEFKRLVRVQVAQLIWGRDEYYRSVHKGLDENVERALHIMKRWQELPAGSITDELVENLQNRQ